MQVKFPYSIPSYITAYEGAFLYCTYTKSSFFTCKNRLENLKVKTNEMTIMYFISYLQSVNIMSSRNEVSSEKSNLKSRKASLVVKIFDRQALAAYSRATGRKYKTTNSIFAPLSSCKLDVAKLRVAHWEEKENYFMK